MTDARALVDEAVIAALRECEVTLRVMGLDSEPLARMAENARAALAAKADARTQPASVQAVAPARHLKPLTDDDLNRIWLSRCTGEARIVAYGRAIEKYHGIGATEAPNETATALPSNPPSAGEGIGSEDAALLDFLEQTHGSMVFKLGATWYWRARYGMPHRRALTLREAIQAARAATPPQPQQETDRG